MTTMLMNQEPATETVTSTETETPVVLLINMTDSRCGNCMRSADPMEPSHLEGYLSGTGCGATYTHVSSDYASSALEERIKEMRPDLIFIDPRTLPRAF